MLPENTAQNELDNLKASTSLITILRCYEPIKEQVEKYIAKNITLKVYKKGEILPPGNDLDQYIYLITKGVVRGCAKDESFEITTWFAKEGTFVSSIFNSKNDLFKEQMQAIEDVEVVVISQFFLNKLYIEYPETNVIGRKMIEHYYQEIQERSFIFRLPSAERKYLHFLNRYPDLFNRVNLKYIASFLGIRVETMSRVRAKL